ncbi:MAG: membrane dipeptidase [Oscillospiraceae bacterium]|nr:membrane dipeptidase [Oscillospiraceae bacterium]
MKFPVFDLHCDTALALLGEDVNQAGSLASNKGHIDLNRAEKLAGYCQCFACFTTPYMEQWHHITPTLVFEREIATIQREIDKNKKRISIAYTPEDVIANQEKGKMSAILTIEGPAGFGFDPELLESMFLAGFRISTLGWNESNPLTGSNQTGGGLTELGKAYVRQAQSLGILVDVSHISDEGFWDIMKITQAPVIASHSNSRALCNHSRNLTDDMFRAIRDSGGVAGINQFADFLGQKPTLDTVCDHIFHFMELDPEGKHIALGGDLDGCEALAEGFEGVQSYDALADRLIARGLDAATVQNIYWNNALGVMATALRNNKAI